MEQQIAGKTIAQWQEKCSLLTPMMALQEVFWANPAYEATEQREKHPELGKLNMDEAEARLLRFAPYIAKKFPETEAFGGLIESPLKKIPQMQRELEKGMNKDFTGSLYLKCDSHLPICGSIKARGGIHEVLRLAETIAVEQGLLSPGDSYLAFDSDSFRTVFSKYSLVVSSTGNLGMSVGIMGATLGFKTIVHMSLDAKQWKKDLLRSKGVTVVEHQDDYSAAVLAGRREAEQDPHSHFVDDEQSLDLFLGYAVAAKRLAKQFQKEQIVVDRQHPLFVYLPCGVGGAPGGLTFGLKSVFGDSVYCFFAEPTHAPAMLLGMMTGQHSGVSVQDFGIDNRTAADGLAVGRPSALVGNLIGHEISGIFTVEDGKLFEWLKLLADTESIYLEPSALAGFNGPLRLLTDPAGQRFLRENDLIGRLNQATHLVWATGGSMVPPEVMNEFYHHQS